MTNSKFKSMRHRSAGSKNIHLKSIKGKTLYTGLHGSVLQALEYAIETGRCLEGVSLKNADLRNANLDGHSLRYASFEGADLTGANISESDLTGCNFTNALLYNTCFCESNLQHAVFIHASFGGTNFFDACLDDCVFQGSSALQLNFLAAYSHHRAIYQILDNHGSLIQASMNTAPVVLSGLAQPIAMFDNIVMLGKQTLPYDRIKMLKHQNELHQIPKDRYS